MCDVGCNQCVCVSTVGADGGIERRTDGGWGLGAACGSAATSGATGRERHVVM